MNAIASFDRVGQEQYAADCTAWGSFLPWEELPLPQRATQGAAGYDFVCPVDCELRPGETALIPTGMRAEIAPGWVLLLFPRSSLGFKHRLMLCNTVGVIDSDYRGELVVPLQNYGKEPYAVQPGERVAQLVVLPVCLLPVVEAEELSSTSRGTGGFGSTGKS